MLKRMIESRKPARDVQSFFELEYELREPCGKGTYGVVRKGRRRHDNLDVAVKTLKEKAKRGSSDEDEILPEIVLLEAMHHPNVVELVDIVFIGDITHIIMKDAGHSLKEIVRRLGNFGTQDIKNVLHDVIAGLEYIHSIDIIHADLKPANIMIGDDSARICDFGCSVVNRPGLRTYSSKNKNIHVGNEEEITLWYRAPEVCLGQANFTDKVDIWSLGCVLVEMATRQPLFGDCTTQVDMINSIFRKIGAPDSDLSELRSLPRWFEGLAKAPKKDFPNNHFKALGATGESLLQQMLAPVPSKRIDAQFAQRHPFLQFAKAAPCYANPRSRDENFTLIEFDIVFLGMREHVFVSHFEFW